MKQDAVKASVRELLVIKFVEALYSPSNKQLHDIMIYIRHDLLAE